MPADHALAPADAIELLTSRAFALETQWRIAIGLAGGPGVGKSTIAAEVVAALNANAPGIAALVPMDGFHMRHAKLEALGTVFEKGAPHTFEGAAFADFLETLKAADGPVNGPGYSRKIEDVVDDAFTVAPEARLLIVEGNYLLLSDPPWDRVRPLLDLAVFFEMPREMVRQRLLTRHGAEGLFTPEYSREHVDRVDMANYDLVVRTRPRADIAIDLLTEN